MMPPAKKSVGPWRAKDALALRRIAGCSRFSNLMSTWCLVLRLEARLSRNHTEIGTRSWGWPAVRCGAGSRQAVRIIGAGPVLDPRVLLATVQRTEGD